MSDVPTELRFLETHEWARREDDDSITVGISDHAQTLLGDVVFVELPEVGQTVKAEEEIAVVESVKAASDVYAPVTGEIIEVNEALTESPALVNQDAYHDGWIFKMRPEHIEELQELLDAEVYQEKISETEE